MSNQQLEPHWLVFLSACPLSLAVGLSLASTCGHAAHVWKQVAGRTQTQSRLEKLGEFSGNPDQSLSNWFSHKVISGHEGHLDANVS